MTKISILAAFASVIYLLEFNLPFFPPFYKMDLSETVVLIGGFAMGPLAALIIELLKMIVNLLVNGTQTAFVGEIANFLIGCSFVLPACFLYARKKTQKNAILGMALGTASLIVIGAFLNYFVLIPAYGKIYGMEMVLSVSGKVMPAIRDVKTLILFATVPFNAIKAIACSLITALLYKRLSPLLHK